MSQSISSQTQAALSWISQQRLAMTAQIQAWSNINSGSYHLAGLASMQRELETSFATIAQQTTVIDLEPDTQVDDSGRVVQHELGKALRFDTRPHATSKVLLAIHYDTVFGASHPFQTARLIDQDTLCGPGVVDAKGGVAVIRWALQAFEQTEIAKRIGWTVLLTPDEELGSPGSTTLFEQLAPEFEFGMVYEPALPDGTYVDQRKGSGNFAIVCRGKSAHAGRDFHSGNNAILALAKLLTDIEQLPQSGNQTTINVGNIVGGGPVNIVPDTAVARINIRVPDLAAQHAVEAHLQTQLEKHKQLSGCQFELHGRITSPPKPVTEQQQQLKQQLELAAAEIGLAVNWQATGGVCDGNKLFAAGLPNIDTLGPVGGNLHRDDEYVDLSSLVPRTQITCAWLLKHAFSIAVES